MKKLLGLFAVVVGFSTTSSAESYKTIFNPFTSRPDYVTRVTSSTIGNDAGLSPSKCVQTDANGDLESSGSACGSGSGGMTPGSTMYIQNSSTLQSGATAFPEVLNTQNGNFSLGIGIPSYVSTYRLNIIDSGNSAQYGIYVDRTGSLGVPSAGVGIYSILRAGMVGTTYAFRGLTNNSGSTNYGVSGEATVGGTSNYGISGTASGATNNYALYGTAPGGGTNYGLYVASGQAQINSSMTVIGPISVNGSGDGEIALTIFNSTYTVASSSVIPSVGSAVVYTSTWGTIGPGTAGATPGAPVNSVQFNSAGALGGNSNFNFSGTSTSIHMPVVTSTLTVLSGGATSSGNIAAPLDVYSLATAGGGTRLATFGTNQFANQVTIIDQQKLRAVTYGAQLGNLNVGAASFLDKVMSSNSSNQHINYWNTGHLDIQSAANGDGGKDIILKPGTVEGVRVSSTTTMTISGAVAASGYQLKVSTSSTFVQIAISTSGHVHANGTKPILSSCGTSPSIIGTDTAFTVTVGATTDVCTITFISPYNTIPTCVVSDQTTSVLNALGYTVSATAVALSKTGLDDELVDVLCFGH